MSTFHPIVRPLAIVAVVSVAVMNTSDLQKFGHQLGALGPSATSSDCSSAGFTFKRQCARCARFVPGH